MTQTDGRLAENIVYFARALRAAGIPGCRPGRGAGCRSTRCASRSRRADFYWTLHAVFVKRHGRARLFPASIRHLLPPPRLSRQADGLARGTSAAAREGSARSPARRVGGRAVLRLARIGARRPRHRDRRPPHGLRPRAVEKKDFAPMSAAEIAAAKAAIKRLVLPLDEIKTRRLAPHPRGHIIDMRRTLRASLKAGGALIDLDPGRRPPAADCRAARYLRLDEPVHKAVPALPACGDGCAKARAHLHVRHPADQRHPRAEAEGPRRGAQPGDCQRRPTDDDILKAAEDWRKAGPRRRARHRGRDLGLGAPAGRRRISSSTARAISLRLSVSGGCVEGAVVTEALDVIAERKAQDAGVRRRRRYRLEGRAVLRRHHPGLRREGGVG